MQREFPFSGYIPSARRESYFEMPRALKRWLEPGARVLDFGAGPCDKTALLSLSGFQVTAFDDWGDDWYTFADHQERILDFARRAGIDYRFPGTDPSSALFPAQSFDAIVLNNVIEHLHDSPRRFLSEIVAYLKEGGILFIDVPNAANLRKRLDILVGRTNYPSFDSFYWSSEPWRGHVREYVADDLRKLCRFLGLEQLQLAAHHYHLDLLSPGYRKLFVALCRLFPGFRESWLLVSRKPAGWRPRLSPTEEEAARAFRKHYFKYDKNMIEWEAE